MKELKLALLSILVLLSSWNVSAQKNIGVRAGYNFASVSGGEISDVGQNNGFYVGVYKEFPFLVKDLLYFVPELQYSKQGFSMSGNDVVFEYINVPVLAKVYVVKVLSLEAGPQFGFKINDDLPGNFSSNGFDTAFAGGLGINFPFGISVNGRYIGSFNEVIKDTGAKNKVFQLGLSYRF